MAKQCNKCNETKESEFYGKDVRNSDGLTGICNLCKQLANKALRDNRILNQSYTPKKDKACSQCKTVKTPTVTPTLLKFLLTPPPLNLHGKWLRNLRQSYQCIDLN